MSRRDYDLKEVNRLNKLNIKKKMNKLDQDYKNLVSDILINGNLKEDRTGTGTMSVFGREIRHKMSDGFPLLTTKHLSFKNIVVELLWFLKGDTNIKYLLENGCYIWVGDVYKKYKQFYAQIKREALNYEEFIKKLKEEKSFLGIWGDLGKTYGAQWRNWEKSHEEGEWIRSVDQIENILNLLKQDPDSRRMLVNAWNVGDIEDLTLPPCHFAFQCYTRKLNSKEVIKAINDIHKKTGEPLEKWKEWNIPTRAISLKFFMRSSDVGLGLPYNLASYGLLLEILAKQVNMIPDELIYSGTDVHIYTNHIVPIKEQLSRTNFQLPTISISDKVVKDIKEYSITDFILNNYKAHSTIKLELSN